MDWSDVGLLADYQRHAGCGWRDLVVVHAQNSNAHRIAPWRTALGGVIAACVQDRSEQLHRSELKGRDSDSAYEQLINTACANMMPSSKPITERKRHHARNECRVHAGRAAHRADCGRPWQAPP